MDYTTSLTHSDISLSESYPSHVTWFSLSEKRQTQLIICPAMLCTTSDMTPIRVRIRLFHEGKILCDTVTRDVIIHENLTIRLNDLIPQINIENGYAEITPYPVNPEHLSTDFLGELWCNVWDDDDKISVTYPPLNFKGVAVKMLDANSLYYPGFVKDKIAQTDLLLLNQYAEDYPAHIQVTRSDAQERRFLEKIIPAKSALRITCEEIIPDWNAFFAMGGGLVTVKFPHKINAYILTASPKNDSIYGIDHMGFMVDQEVGVLEKSEKHQKVCRNRQNDPLICYCKSLTQNDLNAFKVRGMSLEQVMKETDAGLLCGGCTHELAEIFESN